MKIILIIIPSLIIILEPRNIHCLDVWEFKLLIWIRSKPLQVHIWINKRWNIHTIIPQYTHHRWTKFYFFQCACVSIDRRYFNFTELCIIMDYNVISVKLNLITVQYIWVIFIKTDIPYHLFSSLFLLQQNCHQVICLLFAERTRPLFTAITVGASLNFINNSILFSQPFSDKLQSVAYASTFTHSLFRNQIYLCS